MYEAALLFIQQSYPGYRWSEIYYKSGVIKGGTNVVTANHASEGAKIFFLQSLQWDWSGALVPSTQVVFTANGNPWLTQSNIAGFNIVQSAPLVIENTSLLSVIANTGSALFTMTIGYQYLSAPDKNKKAA